MGGVREVCWWVVGWGYVPTNACKKGKVHELIACTLDAAVVMHVHLFGSVYRRLEDGIRVIERRREGIWKVIPHQGACEYIYLGVR